MSEIKVIHMIASAVCIVDNDAVSSTMCVCAREQEQALLMGRRKDDEEKGHSV